MLGAFLLLVLTFAAWFAASIIFGVANLEIREYVGEDFFEVFGKNSNEVNMVAAMYSEGSTETTHRSWKAVGCWSLISGAPVVAFFVFGRLIIKKLKESSSTMSSRTSKIHFELLRALIVQTIIPIFISFSPSIVCWFLPMIGIQMSRTVNYFEVSVFGLFAFVDPVAIALCIPAFRKRLFCKGSHVEPPIASYSAQ
ncbi:Protein CBG26967 [Caenorhabditis briggsae]|uniref:Protein CBG26967 n=1 Tax=Caenorhabditis briggsae TaxID=6238 RepID=B6IET3_CAEBR|nr:Protein CBG26967 [Caenorhabditis briggsae]CAR98413.1 Protein CBG26967 [Caenorhabditis briggsae]